MNNFIRRINNGLLALSLMILTLLLFGCSGGGGGVSAQVVSGTAAVGAPLAGQVSLKDSSSPAVERSTVIGSDGSFAIDVTGMKAPFILQATGSANGQNHSLLSFAGGLGTANVTPISHALVAIAWGSGSPEEVFVNPDAQKLRTINDGLPAAVADLMGQLTPLLQACDVLGMDPLRDRFAADHTGFDGMLDLITVTVAGTSLTIANQTSGAPIFAAAIGNVRNGTFDASNMPSLPTSPVAVTNLAAVGGTGQVTLSWDAVSNATSYNLYYSTSSGLTMAGATKLVNVTSPYVQTGLAAGTTYYYLVTAVNGAGEGPVSTVASATTATSQPVPVVPAAPINLVATGGTNQVSVSWGAVNSASSYNVYYTTSSGVTKSTGTKIANATSPMVQTGLAAGTTYYYVVTSVNSAGESIDSVQVAATTLPATPAPTAPAAPTSITASGGANQATLSWPVVNGASSYNIYWSTTSGVTKVNGTKVAGVTSPYVKTGLAAGTTYYFIVTAVNAVGESAASAQAQASTNPAPPALPAAPAGVTATGGVSQVTLSWSPVSGATSYNLYWSTTTGVTKTSGTKITNAVSPYVQTGLAAGTTYYYVVTAVSSAGEGTASTQASASTSAPALACGSCHAAPPSTGTHTFHIGGEGLSCAVCHGSGYSSTTANPATHMNNVINLVSTIGWNPTSRNCTNSCHGSKNW